MRTIKQINYSEVIKNYQGNPKDRDIKNISKLKNKKWILAKLNLEELKNIILPNHWFCGCNRGSFFNIKNYVFHKFGGKELKEAYKEIKEDTFKKRYPKCFEKIKIQEQLINKNLGKIILHQGQPHKSMSSLEIYVPQKRLFLIDGFHRCIAIMNPKIKKSKVITYIALET